MNTIKAPKFELFRSIVSRAEILHAELVTLDDATKQLEEIKTRIGECGDEDQARKLLSAMRDAEESVVIKQIRGKRLAADLETIISDADKARQAAQSEAGEVLSQAPQQVVNAVSEMVESCRYEGRKPRDPRSLEDLIQTFLPMAVAHRLDEEIRSSTRLYSQDNDSISCKLDVLQQSVAYLKRFHDGRDELAVESARLIAACAAFRKAYAKP
jgi:hypothetical protein